jgi:tetratricopeptide (TPR) repeat protein
MAPPKIQTLDVEPDRPEVLRRRFEELRRKALEAFNQTRFQDSRDLFIQALECAQSLGDRVLEDLAFCGRVASSLALDEGREDVPKLREVLMRSGDDETCFLAAYILATQIFNPDGNYRKTLFYSQVACTHAERLGREDWLASCHNEIANALLATSFFDKACQEYQQALDLVPDTSLLARALILDNVGYCRLVQGRHKEGFGMLFWSLRTLRRLGVRRYQAGPHIGLSYGYINIGRYRSALRHGFEALSIAEDVGDVETTKQALYILGEAAKLAGATHAAYRFYQRLQSEFYPGDNSLAEMLLTVDTHELINLRA